MTTVSVIQSNYIPWKGYFDIINDSQLFIFHDDLQYTKNDWRNRNKIKVNNGTKWLSIPVGSREDRLINEVELPATKWAMQHWNDIKMAYSKAPYFNQYKDFFEHVYLDTKWKKLSELNQFLIKHISTEFLGIKAEFINSSEFNLSSRKLDKLLDLLKKVDAKEYISGPAAKDYIDDSRFNEAGIKLVYKDYTGYPEYSQFHPPFEHYVSIIDLLFHTGSDSAYFIWGWREDTNCNLIETIYT
ncbi:WbqC family protein [Paenibacillus aquistagni]|uniref:WbqC-like protein family protein n=1 Tax=Paenibacillus aquistagni TaxID=1852522 RepID=A0A1X7KYN3_9BACL|nr:WbqC family protein [Paenibacillus aquistagni]SMG46681.1 WbqC-like protein family protein [Paenibacillus aquistagni]